MAGHQCGGGLYCQSFLQKCTPKSIDCQGNSACDSLRLQAAAEDARRANLSFVFGTGRSGGAVAFVSCETGLVYGDKGEFGCCATACAGVQSNVSVGSFATFGLLPNHDDFEGFSVVTSGGVDTPFPKFGLQTSQMFRANAPTRAGDILNTNTVIGTASSLNFGVGLSPVTVGSAVCCMARLDKGDPLGKFSDMKEILESWGKLGFAPEARPAGLQGLKTAAAAPAAPKPLQEFDAAFHASFHPDLRAAFGNDAAALHKHCRESGLKECRRSSAGFSIADDLRRYPDLTKAYGKDCVAGAHAQRRHGGHRRNGLDEFAHPPPCDAALAVP